MFADTPTPFALKAGRFETSLRFELFVALDAVNQPAGGPHPQWHARCAEQLPKDFFTRNRELGADLGFWMNFADIAGAQPPGIGFDGLVAALVALPGHEFARRFLVGSLHDERVVDELLEGKITFSEGIAALPDAKREWLMFIGLYPCDQSAPAVRTAQRMISEPGKLRAEALSLMEIFWESVFERTWRILDRQLDQSARRARKSFASAGLAEIARSLSLRIEVDERREEIAAIRGGNRLPFQRIEEIRFHPSAFNLQRYWTFFDAPDGKKIVIFPYLEPAVSLEPGLPAGGKDTAPAPVLDAALVFRALGDTTRFALAKLIASAPMTATDLAQRLGVTKPTISHHVFCLREAGLIDEFVKDGSRYLSLQRGTIERLTEIATVSLFEDGLPRKFKLTRKSK